MGMSPKILPDSLSFGLYSNGGRHGITAASPF